MNEITRIATTTASGASLGAVNSLALGDVGFVFLEAAAAIGLGGFVLWGGMVSLGGYGIFRFFRDAFARDAQAGSPQS
jgi:hypothetical protein